MDVEEFSDEEWRGVLEELRLLVQRAGYADWDIQMARSLDERSPREDLSTALAADWMYSAHHQLRRYTEELMRLLKSRTRWRLQVSRRSLRQVLRTVDGEPVEDFSVVVGERERSLFERTDEIEAMVEALNVFHAEISGESTGFWRDGSDKPEDQGDDL